MMPDDGYGHYRAADTRRRESITYDRPPTATVRRRRAAEKTARRSRRRNRR